MKSNTQRLVFLDVVKGIGILLVVLGHAISALGKTTATIDYIRYVIYLVHMPLFFVVAGFLFQKYLASYEKHGGGTFVKRKFVLYMVPYATFTIMIFFIAWLASRIHFIGRVAGGYFNFSITPESFLLSLIAYVHPMDGHLWFSYVMFLILIFSYSIRRLQISKLLPLLYILYVITWFIGFPELIWKVFRYMLLFTVGRYWNEMQNLKPSLKINMKAKFFLVATGFIIASSVYYISKTNGFLVGGFVKPIAEISGVVLVVFFSKWITEGRGTSKIKNQLVTFGNESYIIYLVHQPYIVPVVVKIGLGLHLSIVIVLGLALGAGIGIPLILNKFIIKKSRILSLLFLGKVAR